MVPAVKDSLQKDGEMFSVIVCFIWYQIKQDKKNLAGIK